MTSAIPISEFLERCSRAAPICALRTIVAVIDRLRAMPSRSTRQRVTSDSGVSCGVRFDNGSDYRLPSPLFSASERDKFGLIFVSGTLLRFVGNEHQGAVQ